MAIAPVFVHAMIRPWPQKDIRSVSYLSTTGLSTSTGCIVEKQHTTASKPAACTAMESSDNQRRPREGDQDRTTTRPSPYKGFSRDSHLFANRSNKTRATRKHKLVTQRHFRPRLFVAERKIWAASVPLKIYRQVGGAACIVRTRFTAPAAVASLPSPRVTCKSLIGRQGNATETR